MFKIGNEFYLTGLLGLCQLSIKRVASTTGKELSSSYLSLWESWLHSSVAPTPVQCCLGCRPSRQHLCLPQLNRKCSSYEVGALEIVTRRVCCHLLTPGYIWRHVKWSKGGAEREFPPVPLHVTSKAMSRRSVVAREQGVTRLKRDTDYTLQTCYPQRN